MGELFECIEYQRLFWVNPCVVDAQKDYHLKLEITPAWTPENQYTPPIVENPKRPLPTRRTTQFRPRTRATPPPETTTKKVKRVTTVTTVTTASPVTKKEIPKTTTEKIKKIIATTVAPVTQGPTRGRTQPRTTERIIRPVMTPM